MKTMMWTEVIKIGLAAAVIAAAFPDPVWAQALSQSVDEVKTGMKNMPIVLSGLAYLAGGATMLHGAGLLKKHADAPQQNPLAPGVTRMALGGVVCALPTFMGWIATSLKTDGAQNMTFKGLSVIN